LPRLGIEPIDRVRERRTEEPGAPLRDHRAPPRRVQDDLDATSRTILLESNDGFRHASQPRAQPHDGSTCTLTHSFGYLRMV
jgi:hypothetical protein